MIEDSDEELGEDPAADSDATDYDDDQSNSSIVYEEGEVNEVYDAQKKECRREHDEEAGNENFNRENESELIMFNMIRPNYTQHIRSKFSL